MDMMSAAILMTTSAEQMKVRPVSDDLISDQGELQGTSFAKSFNEGIGVSALLQGKNTADEAAIALPGMKGTTIPAKKLQEVADISIGVKAISGPEISAHSELKGAVADRIIQPQATTVAGSQEKISAGDTGTTKVEVPAQVEGTAEDVSPGSPIPYATPAPGATDESLEPHVSIAVGDRPSVSTGDRPVVQKEKETADTVKGDAFTKKTAKTQERAATPKIVQKTIGNGVNAIAVEPKAAMGSSAESAIPVAVQAAAPTVALQAETSKTTDVFSKTVSAVTKPSTGVSPTVDVQIRKEAAPGSKPSVTGIEMTVTAGSDPVAAPKAGVSQEKIAAVTVLGGSEGENKPQTAPASGAALLHSVGIVPTSVVAGNITGEVAATKPLPGDAGAHTAVLPTGSSEQGGSSVVAPSMDGAPRMLTATPTSLEVGIQNGTQGWLKVRAEMTDGGVVNASVSAATSAGQEMLHRELPGLTAYLQEEKVAVNAVIVHAPSAAGADARSSSGTDGAGGQTPQRSNEGEQQHQSLRKTTLNGSEETMTYRNLHGVDEDGSLPLAAYANGGSWLSVRA
jgi:hypothetical protein